MSVPQVDKQPSHHVVRMVYDRDSIKKFFSFNIFLSIVIILMMFYTLSVIDDQSQQIRDLSKMVNQLSFKVDEQALKSMETEKDQPKVEDDRYRSTDLRDIEHVLELHHKELKKIYASINKMEHEVVHDLSEIKTLLQQQKQSSWEIKEIISSLKKKMESIVKMFEDIDFAEQFKKFQYLKPDFESMGEKIKGTFNDIKDKVGDMFQGEQQPNNQKSENAKEQVPVNEDSGFFSGIKNKIKRKVNSWKNGEKQQL